MNKTALRRFYTAIRKAIPQNEQKSKSVRIGMSVHDVVQWSQVRRVHAYRTIRGLNEVDTSWLIDSFTKLQLKIELTIGDMTENAPIPQDQYDLIIIPLLAFDESCHRLGNGGGWYDRFLSTQTNATKIGLAFDTQLAAAFPIEPHDVQLDMVVTESMVFTK
ncbi:MAG: 5-formyltetrahydrofolate cyclo-ligase [Patescibacteria group bacterium]